MDLMRFTLTIGVLAIAFAAPVLIGMLIAMWRSAKAKQARAEAEDIYGDGGGL